MDSKANIIFLNYSIMSFLTNLWESTPSAVMTLKILIFSRSDFVSLYHRVQTGGYPYSQTDPA